MLVAAAVVGAAAVEVRAVRKGLATMAERSFSSKKRASARAASGLRRLRVS